MRPIGSCSRSIPRTSKRCYQSALLLALDGEFAASRALLARLPDETRGRPQALALLAADLAGLGDAAGASQAAQALAGASGLDEADVLAVLPALERAGTDDLGRACCSRPSTDVGVPASAAWQALAAIHVRSGRLATARETLERGTAASRRRRRC